MVDREPAPPSPLLKLSETERYLKLRRAGFKNLCDEFYDNPNDPRYKNDATQCLEREQQTLSRLEEYGVRKIDPVHLREIKLWSWWKDYHQRLYECEKAHTHNQVERIKCDQAWRDYKKTFPASERRLAR